MWCWGPDPPARVPGLVDTLQVSNGVNHSCAVRRNGRVACWFLEDEPDVGGTPFEVVEVPGLDDAVQVSAGAGLSCALRASGTVACWREVTAPSPAPVVGVENIVQIEARGCVGATEEGPYFVNTPCALDFAGQVWCFKYEVGTIPQLANPGQPVARLSEGCSRAAVLADGTFVPDLLPGSLSVVALDDHGWNRAIEGLEPLPAQSYAELARMTRLTDRCGIVDGSVRCWKRPRKGPLQVVSRSSEEAAEEILTSEHCTCALNPAGRLACWGDNEDGTCGVRTTTVAEPHQIPGLPEVVQIGVTPAASCARARSGEVFCWGASSVAQAPEGYDPDGPPYSATPLRIEGITDARDLVVSGQEACAEVHEGGVFCWGAEPGKWRPTLQSDRRPPLDGAPPPVPVERLDELGFDGSSMLRFTAGSSLRCVLRRQGDVYCQHLRWSSGEMQQGPFTPVVLDAPVVDLRGSEHVCALTATDRVYCWGSNRAGQCGQEPGVPEPREVVLR